MGKQTIPFNTPLVVDGQLENVQDALSTPATLTGNGKYTAQCLEYFRSLAPQSRAYLTTSGTAALEFAALVIGIEPGDEVIVPSYTYVSTINAFLLRGATLVYVDVDPGTMNIDHHKIEAAITSKTRAIAPVHYSSIACDMDVILDIAKRHNLKIIEDAACCLSAKFKSQALGSIGDVGCFSFHATKNYNAGGQGGAILVNDPELFDKADTVFENGTNVSLVSSNMSLGLNLIKNSVVSSPGAKQVVMSGRTLGPISTCPKRLRLVLPRRFRK